MCCPTRGEIPRDLETYIDCELDFAFITFCVRTTKKKLDLTKLNSKKVLYIHKDIRAKTNRSLRLWSNVSGLCEKLLNSCRRNTHVREKQLKRKWTHTKRIFRDLFLCIVLVSEWPLDNKYICLLLLLGNFGEDYFSAVTTIINNNKSLQSCANEEAEELRDVRSLPVNQLRYVWESDRYYVPPAALSMAVNGNKKQVHTARSSSIPWE